MPSNFNNSILDSLPFQIWAIVNLGAGLWEVYAYLNRSQLKLERMTVWEKMAKGQITLSNFWIEGWSEYCKVDSRYRKDVLEGGYVWWFELLNALLAFIFIFALALGYTHVIKMILLIGIINCMCYFTTLALEAWSCHRLDTQYAQLWQYPTYYLISGIWLLVPWCLYQMITRC
jgi:hypothetical protein